MRIAEWLNRLNRAGLAPFVQPGESALPMHYSPSPMLVSAAEPIHFIADGSGVTSCCGRTPFELPRTDRLTGDPWGVTCPIDEASR